MRAIRLHPLPEAEHDCPYCRKLLEVLDWRIPGMRNLAELRCSDCSREFYGDLAAGQALYTPMLIEKKSGVVFDKYGVDWFASWLKDSYSSRRNESVSFVVEKRLPITRPVVLLNCLDTLYGHSLLKLLNAQRHLESGVDLIVIVPPFLSWMVPKGVAEVWIVDLCLKRGTEWNDWIAREIHARMETFEAVSLSVALSHPRPEDYDIERFTNVKPFPLEQWDARLERPTVTFIWRDDRAWLASTDNRAAGILNKLRRLARRPLDPLIVQSKLVVELAETLRSEWPTLDFAIAGVSRVKEQSSFPTWIEDLRLTTMNVEDERRICERYASSHVVVGVHGSNMLMPTGHAGSLVELIGADRWGNFPQDILLREAGDCREVMFRYRFLSESTPPPEVAKMVSLVLRGREPYCRLMNVGNTNRNHSALSG